MSALILPAVVALTGVVVLCIGDAALYEVRRRARIRHAKRMVRRHLPEALRGDEMSRRQVEAFSMVLRQNRK